MTPAGGGDAARPTCPTRVQPLRVDAQRQFNEQQLVQAAKLCDAAAALEQSFELLNPNALSRQRIDSFVKDGPSVIRAGVTSGSSPGLPSGEAPTTVTGRPTRFSRGRAWRATLSRCWLKDLPHWAKSVWFVKD